MAHAEIGRVPGYGFWYIADREDQMVQGLNSKFSGHFGARESW